jgi:acetyl-CoA carboxylase biotin carboxyl carrier protein
MDLPRIKSLIEVMADSDLSEMRLTEQGWTLTLSRGSSLTSATNAPSDPPPSRTSPVQAEVLPAGALPSPAASSISLAAAPAECRSPLFGVLHWRAAPQEPLFVSPGQAVKAGQTLCVIEAMKVFNTVTAERDGVVDALLVEAGQEVDVGQPLIRFK